MELRHLRYFVLVAEELHFGNAAKRAGIAQPPLSQQIQSLEAELGVRLFHRTRRRVTLTGAGAALLPEARRLLRDADRAADIARDGAAGVTGRLGLGFVGSLAFGFMPDFARSQRAAAPAVRLELRELTSEQQRTALNDGSIDLGMVRYPIVDDGLVSEALYREPLMIVMPDDVHPTYARGAVPIGALADLPLVMFPRSYGPPFFDRIMTLFQSADISPRIEQEAIQMPTIVSLVAAGAGVAIVPASMNSLRLPGVRFHRLLDVDGVEPLAEVYLVRRSEERSEAVWSAVDLIRELASRLSPEPGSP